MESWRNNKFNFNYKKFFILKYEFYHYKLCYIILI